MKMIGDRFGRKLSVASRRRAKKHRVPEPGRKPTPLLLECLEPRQLMAADVDVAISSPVPHTATTGEVRAHLEDRVLRIEGTDQPDRIIVRELSGEIVIDDVMIQKRGGSVRRMPLEEIDRIDIFGNGGDDVLALLINDLAPLANGAGVYGGSGRDLLVAPAGVSHDITQGDTFVSNRDIMANPLSQARLDLLHLFRDRHGYVGEFHGSTGIVKGDGEATLFTAIAAIAIATDNYHQDAWESEHSNALLESLLQVLLNVSWGNRDRYGQEHPIRHPEWFDHDATGGKIRNSPMSKDAFGAIVAAAFYAYDSPHSSPEVRQLSRRLIVKWSEYLVNHQWRTHSNYIAGEFESREVIERDGNGSEIKKGRSTTLFNRHGEPKMALGPETFILMPHEIIALQNVAAHMGIPAAHWRPIEAMSPSLGQAVADVAAPYLGRFAGQRLGDILGQFRFRQSIDFKVHLGGRAVSVMKGEFMIEIPRPVREKLVSQAETLVTEMIRGMTRSQQRSMQGVDLIGLLANRMLDDLPGTLGKDTWRSLLVNALGNATPWLTQQGLLEAGVFIATLQSDKLIGKPANSSFTLWSFAALAETRPEMADLLQPFVRDYNSLLRGQGNANSLWAWLARDNGRVEDHLAIFENRMRSSDPAERLAPEFAYSSTKFDDFMERSESSNGDGNAYDHSFMRLDYLVLRALSEKGAPRGTGDSVHGWSRSFVEAAENMLAGLEETLRTQWRRLQSDLVSLVRKLRDELNLSIGEVAGIVHGVSRDLGVMVRVLLAADVRLDDVASEAWSRVAGLGELASVLRSANISIANVASQVWARSGNLNSLARALRSANVGIGDVASQVWARSRDLNRLAQALRSANVSISGVASQVWARSGNLNSLARALRSANVGIGDVASQAWARSRDLNRLAQALRSANVSISGVASQVWARSGNLNSLARALRSANVGIGDVAAQVWARTKNLNSLRRALESAGFGGSSIANEIARRAPAVPSIPVIRLPRIKW